MAYSADYREALSFIVTDLLLKANQAGQGEASRAQDMDLIVLKLEAYASCFTKDDTAFKAQWRAVQDERDAKHRENGCEGYVPGTEGFEDVDLALRMKEFACLVRAAYNNGIISKLPTPRTRWDPRATEAMGVEA